MADDKSLHDMCAELLSRCAEIHVRTPSDVLRDIIDSAAPIIASWGEGGQHGQS